jgi:predicted dehydrogenase
VLVCGAGSIGRRHAVNLRQLGADVRLWRKRSALLDETAAALGVEPCRDLETGIRQADAVVVATASDEHVAPAMAAAAAGKHLFVEKPLSNAADGIAALTQMVAARHLVCEIGCQLRAHPALRKLAGHVRDGEDGRVLTFRGVVGQSLDQWRPGTSYRESYSAQAARGGGALFDLIHEIDLALWLAGPMESVYADLRQISGLDVDADDLANVTLVTASGAAGQLQLDMLSPAYRRSFELVTERAVFHWDYASGRIVRRDGKDESDFFAPIGGFERNDLFMAHMRHFLTRLRDPSTPPMCGLDDGVAALDIALAARASAQAHRLMRIAPARSGLTGTGG